jgi:hypothetical protein
MCSSAVLAPIRTQQHRKLGLQVFRCAPHSGNVPPPLGLGRMLPFSPDP